VAKHPWAWPAESRAKPLLPLLLCAAQRSSDAAPDGGLRGQRVNPAAGSAQDEEPKGGWVVVADSITSFSRRSMVVGAEVVEHPTAAAEQHRHQVDHSVSHCSPRFLSK
jgi:hypothetical protein